MFKVPVTEEVIKAFKGLNSLRKLLKEGAIPTFIYCFTLFENASGAIKRGSGCWSVEDNKTTKKVEALIDEWKELAFQLDGRGYTLTASCNKDNSAYLVPEGGELSYYGHPNGTIRFSDHWSWYSSEKKCADLAMVQCPLKGVAPWTRREPTAPTTPKQAICIAEMQNGTYVPISEVVF